MRCGVLVVAVIALPGCVVGGGPVIGYGTRSGVVLGGEAGGGLPFMQGALGVQSGGLGGYGRADLAYDLVGHCDGEPGRALGGRVGIGMSTSDRTFTAAAIDEGFHLSHPDPVNGEHASGFSSWAMHAGLELRRLGDEWLVLLAGRVSLRTQFCASDIPGAS